MAKVKSKLSFSERFNRFVRSVSNSDVDVSYCAEIHKVVQRHLRDLRRKRFKFTFREEYVEHVCQFLELLPLVEGEWEKPTVILDDYQIFFYGMLIGWRTKKDLSRRRFTMCYYEVARKNRKSTMAAMLAVYLFCTEKDRGNKVLCAASTYDQALMVFRPIVGIFENEPDLRRTYGVSSRLHEVRKKDDINASIKAISNVPGKQDGHNVSLAIVDEIHAFRNSALWTVLTSARGARKNNLILGITTAGYEIGGAYYDMHSRAKACLSKGSSDHRFFPLIFRIPRKYKNRVVREKKLWRLANPVLLTKNLCSEYLMEAIEDDSKGCKISAFEKGEFWRKRCNISVEGDESFFDSTAWDARNNVDGAAQEIASFNTKSEVVYAGFDKSEKEDLTALVLVYRAILPGRKKSKVVVEPYFWLPEEAYKSHILRADIDYQPMVERGEINLVPGESIDDHSLMQDICDIVVRRNVSHLYYDSHMCGMMMGNIQSLLINAPTNGTKIERFPQTAANYNETMRRMYSDIIRGDFLADNICLAWNVRNLQAFQNRFKCVRPDRANAYSKIDGAVAMIMAYKGLLDAEAQNIFGGMDGEEFSRSVIA